MQTSSAHKLAVDPHGGSQATRAWHNPIPAWIQNDPGWPKLSATARLVMQAITNECDRPLSDGSLIGGFGSAGHFAAKIGCARSTFWRALQRLHSNGYVVLLARGGVIRLRTKAGMANAANTYGIPGHKGSLSGRAVNREMVQMICTVEGDRKRVVTAPGDQSSFWVEDRTTVVRKSDGGSPKIGLPQSENRTLPSSIPSPIPSPVENNHDHGAGGDGCGVAMQHVLGKSKKHKPHLHIVEEAVLRDTGKLYALFEAYVAAGMIGPSLGERLFFVSAAEHALRVADRNPCGLFAATIKHRGQRMLWVTQADEDRAHDRMSAFDELDLGSDLATGDTQKT